MLRRTLGKIGFWTLAVGLLATVTMSTLAGCGPSGRSCEEILTDPDINPGLLFDAFASGCGL